MKRRSFLHNLSHIGAASLITPNLAFGTQFYNLNSYLNNTIDSGKILLLIKLQGGNDGLNTVIPLDQLSNLNKSRPDVVLKDSEIINLGVKDLGLHPELSGFKSLYEENRLKIIQNVGYETPDFSHFRSMDIWESASDYNKFVTSGWVGRYIENQHPEFPNNYPNENFPDPLSVELGSPSLLFSGVNSFTSFVSRNPQNFQEISADFDNNYDISNNRGFKLDYIQLVGRQSNLYGSRVKEAYLSGVCRFDYRPSGLGSQFEKITKLISGGLNTRIYMAEHGGFDTHDSQVEDNNHSKGVHSYLLKELNESILAFMQNMDDIGRSDDVLVMTYSEFGRTIASNGALGTDHGTAAPMFIFGNKVDSGVLGINPIIPNNVKWQDNLSVEFDFRQVYTSIINQWMTHGPTTAKDVLFKDFDELQIVSKEYTDIDNDGVADINDNCPDTPEGSVVDLNGCVLFTLAANNYNVKSVSASCIGSNNGKIEVNAEDTSYTYQVNISGLDSTYSLSADNNHSLIIEDLEVGVYTINFTIDSQEGYIQSFETTITEPAPLQGKAQVDYFSKTAKLRLSGSEVYYIEVNGQMMASNTNDFSAPLKPGKNIIKVTTPLDCQGIYEEVLFMSEKLRYFPNPVQNELNITVPGTDSEINIEIFTDGGANLYRGTHSINWSRTIQLPMSRYKSGLYIVTGSGKTVNESFKIIKN